MEPSPMFLDAVEVTPREFTMVLEHDGTYWTRLPKHSHDPNLHPLGYALRRVGLELDRPLQ